jgi:hypothetical protein
MMLPVVGVNPDSNGTHMVVVVVIWLVSLIVSWLGGTVVMITVVSQMPVLSSHATIHTVSVPMLVPVVLTLTQLPMIVTVVVVCDGVPAQFNTVTSVIVMPCSTLIHVSSVQPTHNVSRIVSLFGVLLTITVVVSQLFCASHTTTHIVSKL